MRNLYLSIIAGASMYAAYVSVSNCEYMRERRELVESLEYVLDFDNDGLDSSEIGIIYKFAGRKNAHFPLSNDELDLALATAYTYDDNTLREIIMHKK